MEDFFGDVGKHIESYYRDIVDATPKVGLAIVAFVLSWFIASRLQVFAGARLKKRMHDPLLANFISRLLKAMMIIIGVLIVLKIVGLKDIFTSVMAGAGISAFVIGFALKDIGENFLAGILLAFKRPFAIGEIIETDSIKGTVAALNLRDTQIKSGGKDIYIPNALLIKNVLINYTHDAYLSQELLFNVEYGADYSRALQIIRENLKAITGVLLDEKGKDLSVLISAMTTNSVTITAGYWVRTDSGISDGQVKSDAIVKILGELQKAGFNTPTNIVELKQYEADQYSDEKSKIQKANSKQPKPDMPGGPDKAT